MANGPVTVNGITFNPVGDHQLEFDPAARKVSLGPVHVKLGGLTLYKGDLDWTVPEGDRVKLASFDMKSHTRTDVAPDDSESSLDLEGDDAANVQGFALEGEAKLELLKGGKALFTGNIALPDVFTDAEGHGLSGAVQIEADNEHGVRVSGITVKAPLVFVGKVEIHNLFLSFAGEANGDAKGTCNADSPGLRWEGGAEQVVLPTPNRITVDNVGMGFADGGFNYARGTFTGDQPIGAGIRVQKIAISICAGPPVTVEGRIALTALPNDKGEPALKIPDAGLLLEAGDPWSLRAEAPAAIFKADRDYNFRDVFVQYASSGAIDFGARVKFALGLKGSVPVGTLDATLTIDAGVKGWIEGGKFSADVDAQGCFAGRFSVADALPIPFDNICPDVKGVISTKGIALCGELKVGDKNLGGIGAGYAWGGELKFMAGTCDVKNWREQRASASSAGPVEHVTLPGGVRGLLVAVRGIGRAPQIELRGPGGALIRTPADSNEALKSRTALAFVNRGEATTYVVLAAPRGGRWTVRAVAGTIAEVKTASLRAPAKVTARVRGHRLAYRIARVRGQRVTFEERGRGVAHVLGSVAAGGRGTLRFRPADGAGGRRRIVALVEQDGLPRKRIEVATFVAPPRSRPGAPGGVKLAAGKRAASGRATAAAAGDGSARGAAAGAGDGAARPGGAASGRATAAAAPRGLTITWRPAARAARYGVRVVLADGRRLFFLRGADDRVVRLPDAPAGPVSVRVVGLRADNGHGPAAIANTTLGGNR